MIKKAEKWFHFAEIELAEYKSQQVKEDETLNKACFDFQQSLEFALKAVLIELNIEYGKTHNILFLISLIQKCVYNGDDINTINELKEHLNNISIYADTISKWEMETRYNLDFITTNELVEKIIPLIKKTISLIKGYINKDDAQIMNDSINKICNK